MQMRTMLSHHCPKHLPAHNQIRLYQMNGKGTNGNGNNGQGPCKTDGKYLPSCSLHLNMHKFKIDVPQLFPSSLNEQYPACKILHRDMHMDTLNLR